MTFRQVSVILELLFFLMDYCLSGTVTQYFHMKFPVLAIVSNIQI